MSYASFCASDIPKVMEVLADADTLFRAFRDKPGKVRYLVGVV